MKRNIDDFNGMKDFIISIVGVVAWFLIGFIIIVGYFTLETKGESVMLNYISTFFTTLSGMGIVVGFIVYALQKNDKKKELKQNFEHYCNVISEEKEKIIEFYIKLRDIEKDIKDDKLENVSLRFRKDAYTFIIKKSNNKDKKMYSFFINSTIIQMMSQTCNDSLKISYDLYLPLKKLIDETIILERRLYALFLQYDSTNGIKNKVQDERINRILKFELFTKRKRKLKNIKKIKTPTLH
ncbi:hypothetical protein [Proteus sp. TJ1640]|uniref:hypothetical protein n=1 Tax=Proteus sp. TJ1640 TaxID=2050968 RepID=UPI000D68F428|nr:hypothetical protein [Proteus sp. TJ1640]